MKKLPLLWVIVPAILLALLDRTAVAGDSRPPAALLPLPTEVQYGAGEFVLGPNTEILVDQNSAEALNVGKMLAARICASTGLDLKVSATDAAGKQPRAIRITARAAGETLGDEGYRLDAAPDGVVIVGGGAGMFYGTQTLLQLLPPRIFSTAKVQEPVAWSIPAVRIKDQPRFKWRGLLLDVARHFFTVDEVKNFLDLMAQHKLNTLQIHFTDDVGWRLEIKRYPKLTEVAAWRKSIGFGLDPKKSTAYDKDGRYGGFYTQDNIRELLAYARARYITIVPEIEMPGHAAAALSVYPEFSCFGGPYNRDSTAAGIYCPGNDAAFPFLQNVLSEVIDLFPGKYVHMGGDEVDKAIWKRCPKCQARIKQEGLKDEHELQSWFVKRIERFINSRHRTLIGWDEILEGGLAPNATVMSWRSIRSGVVAAAAGHDVVMTPLSHCYLDYLQAKTDEPPAIGGFVPLRTVYAFEPLPAKLAPEKAHHILGAGGNLWSEFFPNYAHLQYMAYPRACAMAELTWTDPQRKDWEDFKSRLGVQLQRLKVQGVNYRAPKPGDPGYDESGRGAQFDYFSNSYSVIGLNEYKEATRVLPDNQFQLANGTFLRLRYGKDLTPLSRRQTKTLVNGYLPIVQFSASDGPVRYDFSAWATPVPGVGDWRAEIEWPHTHEDFLNWVQVSIRNTGSQPAQAKLRGDLVRVVKTSAAAGSPGKVVEEPTDKPDISVWSLSPGQTVEKVFRVRFFEPRWATQFEEADPLIWQDRTVGYWQNLILGRATSIEVPCRKATDTWKAALVLQLMCNDHGVVHAGKGFYDDFWIRDGAYQVMQYEEAGLIEWARKVIDHFLLCQRPDGRFASQERELDANGQAQWALWQYYLISRDRAWLEKAYPAMLRAAEWTRKARRQAAANTPFAGLLPAAFADGEALGDAKHHIVGYDLWNLRGMLSTAEAARTLGRTDQSRQLFEEAAAYRTAINAARQRTGLAYFPAAWEWPKDKSGTFWGNTETLWPTPLSPAEDPCVAGTIEEARLRLYGGFKEGTIRWGDGAIHPYMSVYTTMASMIRGEHEQAVQDFYWYLLHSTATHGFPEGVFPERREAWGNTIPHALGAANYANLLRHMLIHESGDELHLLLAVPDWWLAEGQEIRVQRAWTHFGSMGLIFRGKREGVQAEITLPRGTQPKLVVLHLPRSRGLLSPIPGVEVRFRADQRQRWDFPTVVKLYGQQAPPAPASNSLR